MHVSDEGFPDKVFLINVSLEYMYPDKLPVTPNKRHGWEYAYFLQCIECSNGLEILELIHLSLILSQGKCGLRVFSPSYNK